MGIVSSMKRIEMKIRPMDFDKNGMLYSTLYLYYTNTRHFSNFMFFADPFNLPANISDFFEKAETTAVHTRYT